MANDGWVVAGSRSKLDAGYRSACRLVFSLEGDGVVEIS